MSRSWKYIAIFVLLTANFSTATLAQEIAFTEIERVKIGKSESFQAIGSLSDGTAIVLTSPVVGGKIRGFSLSKVADKQSMALAYFKAEPLSIAAKNYFIKDAIIQVDRDDNIIVLYNVITSDNKSDSGTELQIAAFNNEGKLKYKKLLNKNGRSSYIDTINAGILPNGNILTVYNFRSPNTTNVFMTQFTPDGDIINSRQVSNTSNIDNVSGDKTTFASLPSGRNLAIGPSGQFRIIWSQGRPRRGASFFNAMAIATYGKSGQRKSLEYVDERKNTSFTSLSTFFRKDGEFSDVANTYNHKRIRVKFYRELASGKRGLVRERNKASQEGAWSDLIQYKENFALYVSQYSSFDCYLSYTDLSNGDALGAIRLNSGRLANKCGGGTITQMSDGSIGSIISISGNKNVETYFVRHMGQ